jgi:cytochrome c oxidase subunit II
VDASTPGNPHAAPSAAGADGPRSRRGGRSRRPASRARTRWLLLPAIVAGGLLLAGCQLPNFGAHKAITSQGEDAIKLWQGFFIAGAAVFFLVFCLIGWALLRYRRRSDALPRQTQYHTLTEIFYTVVPVIFVLVLFVFTFVTENEVDALPNPKMAVTVTAFQWGWKFTYPYTVDGTTRHFDVIGIELEEPEMVLPAHETIRINLKSADVIHGFYVPAFDFSRYAQPGITNRFTVNIANTGTYRGQCTQFCGLYHSLMRFRVKVDTQAQFAAWERQAERSTSSSGSITQEKKQITTSLGGVS